MKSTAFVVLLAAASALSQQSNQRRPPQNLASPEYLEGGRVTFRLRAPRATEVTLRGDWTADPVALVKSDDGIWSATVGPLPGEVYAYSFNIDGVTVADPQNPQVKLAARGASQSLVAIPGAPPQIHDPRDVPHGTVQENWYHSKTIGELRHFYVYAPPNYDARSAAGYPVLVLLHGAGNAETNWQAIGRANFIIDNLLAEKKVKPMLLVMPFGHALPPNAPDQQRNNIAFEQDLLRDIIPAVESRYRVAPGARNRAVAGLSMGGMQALAIGLRNPDKFAWIGVFSPIMERDFENKYAAELAASDMLNKQLSLLWVGCGSEDQLFKGTQALHETLTRRSVKHEYHATAGRHSWVVWRKYLAEMAPALFTR